MTITEKTNLIKELRKLIKISRNINPDLEKETIKALTKILNIV